MSIIRMQTTLVPTDVTIMTTSQDVGQPLTLQCDMTSVRGITSRVDIIWRNISNSAELDRMDNVNANITGDSVVYSYSYTIPQLTTSYHGREIRCEVVINNPVTPVRNDTIFTLDIAGK